GDRQQECTEPSQVRLGRNLVSRNCGPRARPRRASTGDNAQSHNSPGSCTKRRTDPYGSCLELLYDLVLGRGYPIRNFGKEPVAVPCPQAAVSRAAAWAGTATRRATFGRSRAPANTPSSENPARAGAV